MGSVVKNSISEVWKNKQYEEFRKLHLTNSRQECSPCNQCPLW